MSRQDPINLDDDEGETAASLRRPGRARRYGGYQPQEELRPDHERIHALEEQYRRAMRQLDAERAERKRRGCGLCSLLGRMLKNFVHHFPVDELEPPPPPVERPRSRSPARRLAPPQRHALVPAAGQQQGSWLRVLQRGARGREPDESLPSEVEHFKRGGVWLHYQPTSVLRFGGAGNPIPASVGGPLDWHCQQLISRAIIFFCDEMQPKRAVQQATHDSFGLPLQAPFLVVFLGCGQGPKNMEVERVGQLVERGRCTKELGDFLYLLVSSRHLRTFRDAASRLGDGPSAAAATSKAPLANLVQNVVAQQNGAGAGSLVELCGSELLARSSQNTMYKLHMAAGRSIAHLAVPHQYCCTIHNGAIAASMCDGPFARALRLPRQ